MKINKALLLLLFLTAIFSLSQAQNVVNNQLDEEISDQIVLKLNLKANDRYRYSSQIKTKVSQQIMDNELETISERNIQFLWEIENNENNTIKIKTTIEKIAIILKSPENRIVVDSDKTEGTSNSPYAKFYASFINNPFYITLNSEGNILGIEGLSNNNNLHLNHIGAESDSLTNYKFSEDFDFLEDIKEALHVLPSGPVRMGESWTNKSNNDLENRLGFNVKKTFTLESLSEDLAWINVNHEIHQNNNSDIEEDTKIGNQEGTIEIDLSSGAILHSEFQTEIDGIFHNKAQGSNSPIQVSSTKTLKGEKL